MRRHGLTLLLLAGCLLPTAALAEEGTRAVVLGTGTPAPDYKRSGPSIAVIHKGQAYVFDVGDAMVRRAIEASLRLGIKELAPTQICCVFLTHLHSDHIYDLPALAATLWWDRDTNLEAWGPRGLEAFTRHMNAMMDVEGGVRARGTPREIIKRRYAYRVSATEIAEGIVFRRDDLSIEAFLVPHGDIRPAYGYKITTADRSIVISGDTSFSETVLEKARGVDLLFHEVVSRKGLEELPEFWHRYHGSSHTMTDELARLASAARPKKLVLYHALFFNVPEQQLVEEIRSGYDGEVVLADDLDVF